MLMIWDGCFFVMLGRKLEVSDPGVACGLRVVYQILGVLFHSHASKGSWIMCPSKTEHWIPWQLNLFLFRGGEGYICGHARM